MPNGNDASMEDLFAGIGGIDTDWLGETAFTPAERFRQFATRRTAPGSVMRNALYGLQSPLLQQYYLGGFGGGTPRFGTQTGFGGSFADFMGGYTGATPTDLRSLAGEIGRISQMPEGTGPGGFLEYLTGIGEPVPGAGVSPGPAVPRTISPEEATLFRELYASGQGARENRLGLANLLALQRPGGGLYGGVVGQAMGGVLNELYDAYVGQNPMGNFLNYFLTQTGGGTDASTALSQLYG